VSKHIRILGLVRRRITGREHFPGEVRDARITTGERLGVTSPSFYRKEDDK
jgi:hypothetical protein